MFKLPNKTIAPPAILCVDDERAILYLLKRQLSQKFGYDLPIEIAQSPSEALEFIKQSIVEHQSIGLVISDFIMPEMNGDVFLTKIHVLLPFTPKILLTGQLDIEREPLAIDRRNVFAFVPKPWEPSELNAYAEEAYLSFCNAVSQQEVSLN